MKKIGLICLALVLALGALGVGAALWMGVLGIHGEVATGSVDAVWSLEGFYKTGDDKDISTLDVTMPDPGFMEIWIGNAYPSVTYTVDWNIECTGTVPIHFLPPDIMTGLPVGATFIFDAWDVNGVPIDWTTLQLHPGEVIFGTIIVHLDNTAEQNMTYVFDIFIPFGQYNEFP